MVIKKKQELQNSKISHVTKRQKITSFIPNTLKSRQEEIPIVKHFIDNAKCEPLHLRNNVCKELFGKCCLHVRYLIDVNHTKIFLLIIFFINLFLSYKKI